MDIVVTVLLEAGAVNVVVHRILTGTFLDQLLEECTRIIYYFSWSRNLRANLTESQSEYHDTNPSNVDY